MIDLTVVIITWNSWDFLKECLHKLKEQTCQNFSVLVIDNASTVEMPENFFSHCTNVKFIQNKLNVGFAAGNNQAIKSLSGKGWCVLLNPDAFPEPDWLDKLVAAAFDYPDVSVFASRQLMYYDPSRLDGDGDVYHISGLFWRRDYGKLVCEAGKSNQEVFSACAAAAMYKTEALQAVGGFDDDFFCYAEDVDLGFRLRLAGYKTMLVADAVVHHVGSASTGGQRSDFSVYHGHRNLVWTFVKNMPSVLFWLLLPVHLGLNVLTIMLFTLRGQGNTIFRAKFDAIAGLPGVWRKRRDIQKKRVASIIDIWRLLDKGLVKK